MQNSICYSKSLKVEKKDRNFSFVLFQILMFMTFSLSLISSGRISNILVLASIVVFALLSPEKEIYFLVGLSVYESSFKLSGNNAWFILVLILVMKMIFKSKGRIKKSPLICAFLLSGLEFLRFDESLGQTLVNISLIIFVFVILDKYDKFKMDISHLVFSLTIAFAFAMYYIIASYGGFSNYMDMMMSSKVDVRFGHEFGTTIGGAMAIPLYALMIISLSLVALFGDENCRCKLLHITCSLLAIVFGALTISRSFYIGLLTIVCCFMVFKINIKYKMALIGAIVLLAFLLWTYFDDVVNQLWRMLFFRVEGDSSGTGGRFEIWVACIDYLLNHPLELLFGLGANYIEQGASSGALFSAGAHNMFIDIIMSWGIVGFTMILSLFVECFNKAVKKSNKSVAIAFLPLVTLIIFSLTALRTVNLKTWLYLIICLMMVNALFRKGEMVL